jgi:hypothetical protein
LFQAHPLESGPRAGQSSPAGRLLGVVQLVPHALR